MNGYYSLQSEISGSGTAKYEVLLSNDGVNFIVSKTIKENITAASGPDADGNDIYSFSTMVAGFCIIRVTETGGANSVTITNTLLYQ